jgi:hypothetical protein
MTVVLLLAAAPCSEAWAAKITSYYRDATVFRDRNGNGKPDNGEPSARTDANGGFDAAKLRGKGPLRLQGGIRRESGEPNTLSLTMPTYGKKGIGVLTSVFERLLQKRRSTEVQKLLGVRKSDIANFTAAPAQTAKDRALRSVAKDAQQETLAKFVSGVVLGVGNAEGAKARGGAKAQAEADADLIEVLANALLGLGTGTVNLSDPATCGRLFDDVAAQVGKTPAPDDRQRIVDSLCDINRRIGDDTRQLDALLNLRKDAIAFLRLGDFDDLAKAFTGDGLDRQLRGETFVPVPDIIGMQPNTGANPADHITRSPSLSLKGTVGATAAGVFVYQDGDLVFKLQPDQGNWLYSSLPLRDGVYTFTATGVLATGKESAQSAPFAVTVDATPPQPPTVASPPPSATATPTVTGTWSGAADESLSVTVNSVPYTTDNGLQITGGAWQLTIPQANALPAGASYNVAAVATDRAGNSSADASANEIQVLPSEPPPPPPGIPEIVALDADAGGGPAVHVNVDGRPVLRGRAGVNTQFVRVYRDGVQAGADAPVGPDGRWRYDSPLLANGGYQFVATGFGSGLESAASAVFEVTVRINKPPFANAGGDLSADEGAPVTLDGAASSDPDGDALTYQWTAPDGVALTGATTQQPSFAAPQVAADTPYAFSLVVTDAHGASSTNPARVVVTVRNVNKAPTADAGLPQAVNENRVVTLDGSGSSDPDPGESAGLAYLWTAPDGIVLSDATAPKPSFAAPEVAADTPYTFALVVTDPRNKPSTNPAQVAVTVKNVDKAPTADAGPPQSAVEGTPVALDGSASSDPDAGETATLQYLWTAPDGVALSDATAQKPGFTAPQVAADTDYNFRLVVTDIYGAASAPAQVTVTVRNNRAPTANAGPAQTVNEGAVGVALDGSLSSDPDAGETDSLTYLWTAPGGIVLSDARVQKPTFTAPPVAADTDYTFTLVVADIHGLASADAAQVVVTVTNNRPPTAHAGPAQTVNEGATATLDGSLSSDQDAGETATLAYQWTAPGGIALSNAAAQRPTFTAPQVDADRDYTFGLVVTDSHGDSSAAAQVVVTVTNNHPPTANAGPAQSVTEGAAVTLDGSASSDPDAGETATLRYQWTAPGGITLSSATARQPTFTAPQVDADRDYTFGLGVTDSHGDSSANPAQVVITVKNNRAPTANAGTAQRIGQGRTVTLDGSLSSDPDPGETATLRYQWTAPDGIVLDDATAQQPTFAAPEVAADTPYTFSLGVTDAHGVASANTAEVVVTVLLYAQPLNDTGITLCGDATAINGLDCATAGLPPGQDAVFGRDALAVAGTLAKTGNGHAGFDFTRIDSNGNPLPESAFDGPCVRDNLTGLMWEVKTTDGGLHDMGWTYTWYEPDGTKNGGLEGAQNVGGCGGTSDCDTHGYVQAVNAAGWCGHNDWRMPTVEELGGITSLDRSSPAIDTVYFPATQQFGSYGSSSPYASNDNLAWSVDFNLGGEGTGSKFGVFFVRLVRGGQ